LTGLEYWSILVPTNRKGVGNSKVVICKPYFTRMEEARLLLFQCAANALEYRPESVFSVWSASMRSVLSDHFDLEERT